VNGDEFNDFFVASAGVAGALIGLLFVAISVAPERVIAEGAERRHQVRALAALTAFINALTVSLFALIPHMHVGYAVISIGTIGLIFLATALLGLVRERVRSELHFRDLSFLFGLLVVFALQLYEGLRLVDDPESTDAGSTVCVLVTVCFFIGISRSWELIGGPRTSLLGELRATFRARQGSDD
jgi:hypothetical protein